MKLTFASMLDGEPSFMDIPFPKRFETQSDFVNEELSLDAGWGSILVKRECFENVCLLCSEGNLTQKCEIKLQSSSFCCLIVFVLDGEVVIKSVSGKEKNRLLKNHYYTFCTSELDTVISVEKSTQVFTICLTSNFYLEIFK